MQKKSSYNIIQGAKLINKDLLNQYNRTKAKREHEKTQSDAFHLALADAKRQRRLEKQKSMQNRSKI